LERRADSILEAEGGGLEALEGCTAWPRFAVGAMCTPDWEKVMKGMLTMLAEDVVDEAEWGCCGGC